MVRASVIICVYNRGHEAQACLDSLLAMDYNDYELVLVDDASTDDTPVLLEAFQQSHPDTAVTIVRNEYNRGVSGARNAGIDAAKGELVFFTDSDCTVEPQWLGAFVAPFDDSQVAAAAGTIINPPPANAAERAYVGTSRIGRSTIQGRGLVGCNMGFRRALAARYYFDESLTYYCDDDDIQWRLESDGHRIAFVPEAVVHHNHHLTLRRYFRQGFRQGRGSARYWYKRGRYVGRDLAGLALALLSLPLLFWDARLAVVPVFFAVVQVAAIVYNEKVLKGKGWLRTLRVLPVCLLYYVSKASGVLTTYVSLLLGGEKGVRASKSRWRHHRSSDAQATS